MNKNIAILALTITLVFSTLYQVKKFNTLKNSYEKTCASSVKKSERISQLVNERK